jgi:hypothetical protein
MRIFCLTQCEFSTISFWYFILVLYNSSGYAYSVWKEPPVNSPRCVKSEVGGGCSHRNNSQETRRRKRRSSFRPLAWRREQTLVNTGSRASRYSREAMRFADNE